MSNTNRLEQLFQRQISFEATPEERSELMELVQRPENEAVVIELIHQVWLDKGNVMEMDPQSAENILRNILNDGKKKQPARIIEMPSRRRKWMVVASAAAVLLFVVGAYWFNQQTDKQSPVTTAQTPAQTIVPGRDAAILTLADGRQILLDSASGTITNADGIQIINTNGLLSYQGEGEAGEMMYNTITTARGNQYQLQLEDGTKVWLNSASSLRYPVAFTGNDRQVELTGEGYFEVAKSSAASGAKQPFLVDVNGVAIEVLGTEFNVNSYQDEDATKATLIEGSVKISAAGQSAILKPREQAVKENSAGAAIQVTRAIDMDQVLAWKNGIFLLDNTDVATIMRQISRWYDVDVVYNGKVPDRRFGGGVSKKLPLSEVLKLLEANGLRFTLQGKKLIVQP